MINKFKPIGINVLLAPSESKMRGTIFIPDAYKGGTTSCLVVDVGSKVSHYIKAGDLVMCQAGIGDRGLNPVDGENWFLTSSVNVYAKMVAGVIFPIGNKILVRRQMEDFYTASGIVIPENRRYQSMDCSIERLGLTRKPYRTQGLKLGMDIRMKEWNESMIQIQLEDGSHGIIINESDLLLEYA